MNPRYNVDHKKPNSKGDRLCDDIHFKKQEVGKVIFNIRSQERVICGGDSLEDWKVYTSEMLSFECLSLDLGSGYMAVLTSESLSTCFNYTFCYRTMTPQSNLK